MGCGSCLQMGKTFSLSFLFFFLFFFFSIYFERQRRRGRERGRESQAGSVPSAQSQTWGSDSLMVRSWPEWKPRGGHWIDWAPQAPLASSLAALGYITSVHLPVHHDCTCVSKGTVMSLRKGLPSCVVFVGNRTLRVVGIPASSEKNSKDSNNTDVRTVMGMIYNKWQHKEAASARKRSAKGTALACDTRRICAQLCLHSVLEKVIFKDLSVPETKLRSGTLTLSSTLMLTCYSRVCYFIWDVVVFFLIKATSGGARVAQ